MAYEIVNLVCTADIATNINLHEAKEALSMIGEVKYDPTRFPGLILKLNGVSVLVFRTGRLVIAGARSIDKVKDIVKRVVSALRDYLPEYPSTVKVRIQNMVAKMDLGVRVDLEEIARSTPNVFYEPEQFPGLIYRPPIGKPVLLVFSTGRVVIVGARSVEDIDRAYHEAKKLVKSNPAYSSPGVA